MTLIQRASHFIAAVFFTLPLSLPLSSYAEVSSDTGSACVIDTLSNSLAALSPAMNEVLQYVRGLDPKLVSMEKTPGWQDIEDLKAAIEKLKTAKTDLFSQGRLEEARSWAIEAEKTLKADTKLSAIAAQVQGAKLTRVYQPGERALKRLYLKLLYALDREIPSEIRIPFKHLPIDPRAPKLIEQAQKLVSDQEAIFDRVFSTTGFPDEASYRAALASMGGTYKTLLDALDRDQYQFAIRRPDNARWWIPKVGFQNQRTTQSSRGTFDPNRRDEAEAKLTRIDPSLYKNFDNELKPEYGYLRPAPELGISQGKSADYYGPDVYIFKKDRVKDRMTWTPGDSLGAAEYTSLDPTGKTLPDHWQAYFATWKHRSLIVPFVENYVETSHSGFSVPFMPISFEEGPLKSFNSRMALNGYIELQYFGPISLDDVEAFEFHEKPPSGEFLDELKKRSIKIFDGRLDPAVEWKEGTP